jgi:hypothetical protein
MPPSADIRVTGPAALFYISDYIISRLFMKQSCGKKSGGSRRRMDFPAMPGFLRAREEILRF